MSTSNKRSRFTDFQLGILVEFMKEERNFYLVYDSFHVPQPSSPTKTQGFELMATYLKSRLQHNQQLIKNLDIETIDGEMVERRWKNMVKKYSKYIVYQGKQVRDDGTESPWSAESYPSYVKEIHAIFNRASRRNHDDLQDATGLPIFENPLSTFGDDPLNQPGPSNWRNRLSEPQTTPPKLSVRELLQPALENPSTLLSPKLEVSSAFASSSSSLSLSTLHEPFSGLVFSIEQGRSLRIVSSEDEQPQNSSPGSYSRAKQARIPQTSKYGFEPQRIVCLEQRIMHLENMAHQQQEDHEKVLQRINEVNERAEAKMREFERVIKRLKGKLRRRVRHPQKMTKMEISISPSVVTFMPLEDEHRNDQGLKRKGGKRRKKSQEKSLE